MSGVFDKLVGSINKGVATVGTGSKAMIEKSRIKTIIRNLENERKNLAELLGMKVYEKYAKSEENFDDESMKNFILEIKNRLSRIDEQQAELKRIDDEMGQITNTREEPYVDTGNTCACGHAIPQGAKFCVKCGNSL